MTTKRKTAVDYRQEYKEASKAIKSIAAHVRKRVIEMSELYPDTVVMGDVKAISLTKKWISEMQIEILLFVLDRLEANSDSKQKVIQKKIEL